MFENKNTIIIIYTFNLFLITHTIYLQLYIHNKKLTIKNEPKRSTKSESITLTVVISKNEALNMFYITSEYFKILLHIIFNMKSSRCKIYDR